jgi:nucleoside-diphosphate-sugar epimerase
VDLNNEVFCFSSVERHIELPDGQVLNSKAFSEILNFNQPVTGIFHLAFLTRDYVQKLGLKEYVAKNSEILLNLESALSQIERQWTIGVSSGAVYDFPSREFATDIELNPYGVLKLREEQILDKSAQSTRSVSIVGRLWGCTGRTMPIERKYAISDFIYQGMTSSTIRVNTAHEVWRRYINSQDFLRILHQMAISGESQTVDSGGPVIEIGELASKIAEKLNVSVERSPRQSALPGDFYYPTSQEMKQFANRLGTNILSIDEQIELTIEGHGHQLNPNRWRQ